jgi:hypothetical protein
MNTSISLVFAAACAAASAAAHALPLTDNASVEFFAGTNAAVAGDFRGNDLAFQLPGSAGAITYDHLNLDDAYHGKYTAGAELDFKLAPQLTAFGRAAYSQFDGSTERVGTFEPQSLTPLSTVTARFGDTASRELALGMRYNFLEGARVQPFVGAAVGATRLDATYATIEPIGNLDATRVRLSNTGSVFEQRLETGVQYSPWTNFDLRLTAAASHVDGVGRSDDPNLALVGLDNVHGDVRGHWNYPAELGGVWHF